MSKFFVSPPHRINLEMRISKRGFMTSATLGVLFFQGAVSVRTGVLTSL